MSLYSAIQFTSVSFLYASASNLGDSQVKRCASTVLDEDHATDICVTVPVHRPISDLAHRHLQSVFAPQILTLAFKKANPSPFPSQ